MLLAIDIGNSNIVLGIFRGSLLVKTLRLETKLTDFSKNIAPFSKSGIKNIIISSVVPSATQKIKKSIKKILKINPIILGIDAKVPIKNLYKNPKEVGQDRLVNSFASKALYGCPSITIDFGTAITFDIVSKEGAYIGGLIFPGLELSLNALSKRAALLPKKIRLKKPKDVIGKTTIESMRSGIFYGIGSLCDGVIEKINRRLNFKPKVIATGGNANAIMKFCKFVDEVDVDLTLKGLRLIFEEIC